MENLGKILEEMKAFDFEPTHDKVTTLEGNEVYKKYFMGTQLTASLLGIIALQNNEIIEVLESINKRIRNPKAI